MDLGKKIPIESNKVSEYWLTGTNLLVESVNILTSWFRIG